MTLKFIVTAFCMSICFSKVHAQLQMEGSSKYNDLNLSQSQNASDNSVKLKLQDIAKGNVDYSGTPDISIPLYTVEQDGTNIPIVLRYNPNNTKVDDEGSWVGFGWDLEIGGNVSRSVMGTPDDVVITDRNSLNLSAPSTQRIANSLRGYGVSGAKNILNYDWFTPLGQRASMIG